MESPPQSTRTIGRNKVTQVVLTPSRCWQYFVVVFCFRPIYGESIYSIEFERELLDSHFVTLFVIRYTYSVVRKQVTKFLS